jgi:uncharacterized membrane protein YdjX (TVP38/TMEM64 family)
MRLSRWVVLATACPHVTGWQLQQRSQLRTIQHSCFHAKLVRTFDPRYRSAACSCSAAAAQPQRKRQRHVPALSMIHEDEDWENAEERGEWEGVSNSISLSREQIMTGVMVLGTIIAGALLAATAVASASGVDVSPDNLFALLRNFHPAELLQLAVSTIQAQGPMGYVYFGLLYVLAEILAIPAIPLTASSGYLFGMVGGCSVVLVSATVAAAISFLLGRTFLRKFVENLLGDNPRFRAIDAAIAKEGFKIILLLRLSPIFPFAISNYLYGLTSVPFWQYLGASMLGFFPGTVAYVYGGGQVGALVGGTGGGLPWYGYAAGLAFAAASIKVVGDIATKAVTQIEPGIGEHEWD